MPAIAAAGDELAHAWPQHPQGHADAEPAGDRAARVLGNPPAQVREGVGARRPFADAVSHPPRIGLDALFETLDLVRHALAVFRYLTLDLIWFLAHCMSSLIESMVRCGLNEMRFSRKYAI